MWYDLTLETKAGSCLIFASPFNLLNSFSFFSSFSIGNKHESTSSRASRYRHQDLQTSAALVIKLSFQILCFPVACCKLPNLTEDFQLTVAEWQETKTNFDNTLAN